MKRLIFAFFGALALLSFNVLADDAIETGTFNNKAIYGYDTVAYFTDNKAVEGSSDYISKWHGADWYFVSAEHKKMFDQNPEKYAPQYGGYCAYAMSSAKFYKVDPEVFTVLDGKLYLNYSKGVQKKWDKDQANFISKADEAYPTLVDLSKF